MRRVMQGRGLRVTSHENDAEADQGNGKDGGDFTACALAKSAGIGLAKCLGRHVNLSFAVIPDSGLGFIGTAGLLAGGSLRSFAFPVAGCPVPVADEGTLAA